MEKHIFTPIFVKRPREGAPEFVKCELSFRTQEMRDWLSTRKDEYTNLTMKTSKKGVLYLEVNNWKPNPSTDAQGYQGEAEYGENK